MKYFTSRDKEEKQGTERRLITHLNRVSGFDGKAVSALLSQKPDWDFLYRTSAALFAAPLFYWNLKPWAQEEPIASELIPYLREEYHETLARNIHLLHECDTLLKKLAAKGIAVIPLKGAALARDLYPSIALRPMYDIDLLVRKEDLSGVDEMLRKNRYRPLSAPDPDKGFTYESHYIKETKTPVVLEIHWNLGEENRYRLDIEGIWKRSVPNTGGNGLEMSAEDTLLYLAQHFFKHYLFKRLIWLCDIHEWIDRKEIRWDLLMERARSQSLATFLFYTLKIYEAFYATALPLRPESILKIGPLRRTLLDGYVRRFPMFRPVEKENYLRQRIFAFSCIDRMSDRLRFTMDVLRRDRERRSA